MLMLSLFERKIISRFPFQAAQCQHVVLCVYIYIVYLCYSVWAKNIIIIIKHSFVWLHNIILIQIEIICHKEMQMGMQQPYG